MSASGQKRRFWMSANRSALRIKIGKRKFQICQSGRSRVPAPLFLPQSTLAISMTEPSRCSLRSSLGNLRGSKALIIVTARPSAFSGDENASCAPALPKSERSAVMKRRRLNQTTPSDEHLEEQIKRLRKEAQGTPPGVEREKLIRQARKAEAVARIQEWLSSPGLQPSK